MGWCDLCYFEIALLLYNPLCLLAFHRAHVNLLDVRRDRCPALAHLQAHQPHEPLEGMAVECLGHGVGRVERP